MKRIWLRRLTWGVVGLAALMIGLAVFVILSRNALSRWAVRSSLARQTGLGIRLDEVGIGLRDGTLEFRNLVISNPPGFGPRPLLALPELFLQYDSAAAISNELRFTEARIHLEEINVIVDRAGRTNLMQMAGSLSDPQRQATNFLGGMEFGGIGRLTLTLGRVAFSDERDPRRNVRFDLGITNRTLTNVTSVAQLLPLALEIAFRGGMQAGLPLPSLPTPPPSR